MYFGVLQNKKKRYTTIIIIFLIYSIIKIYFKKYKLAF